MSRRDLKYESIAFSVDNLLELLDECSMKFVELVLREHLSDELPQNNLITILLAFSLASFYRLDKILSLGRLRQIVFTEFLSHVIRRVGFRQHRLRLQP